MSKKCAPLWREAHFEVKMYKTRHSRTTFGSCDVEKVHALEVRSTFPSQNVQNTTRSRHFWKLRCRKSVRRCGAKHISISKCRKHHMFAPLLEVQMSLRFTTLYTPLHYTTLHYITLHYTTFHHTSLHYTPLHYNYNYTTTPHYTPLTPLHYITLHHTTLHYTTLPSTTLHYITLHYTPLHYKYNYTTTQLHNYIPLHSTTLNYTTLHYTPLHYITLHSTTLQLKLHNYTTTLH